MKAVRCTAFTSNSSLDICNLRQVSLVFEGDIGNMCSYPPGVQSQSGMDTTIPTSMVIAIGELEEVMYRH